MWFIVLLILILALCVFINQKCVLQCPNFGPNFNLDRESYADQIVHATVGNIAGPLVTLPYDMDSVPAYGRIGSTSSSPQNLQSHHGTFYVPERRAYDDEIIPTKKESFLGVDGSDSYGALMEMYSKPQDVDTGYGALMEMYEGPKGIPRGEPNRGEGFEGGNIGSLFMENYDTLSSSKKNSYYEPLINETCSEISCDGYPQGKTHEGYRNFALPFTEQGERRRPDEYGYEKPCPYGCPQGCPYGCPKDCPLACPGSSFQTPSPIPLWGESHEIY